MLSFKIIHQSLIEKSFLPLLQLTRISCFDKGFSTAQQVSDWASQTVLSNLFALNDFITTSQPQPNPPTSLSKIKEFLSLTLGAAPYGEECDAAYETYFTSQMGGNSENLVPPLDVFETRNLLIETSKLILVLDGIYQRNVPEELIIFKRTTVQKTEIIDTSKYPPEFFPVASKVVTFYNYIINDMKTSFASE